MPSSEQILETAAQGGPIDLNEWPRVLEDLLKRLHDIVYNEFPIPSVPVPVTRPLQADPEVIASTPPSIPTNESTQEPLPVDTDTELATNSQDSSKENEKPADDALARRERNKRPTQPNTQFEIHNSQRTEEVHSPQMDLEPDPGTLPPELLSLYQTSTRILQNDFAHSPPYTIQRLSEMVLKPRQHYRFLPAYLRAIDRIVSVTSPVSDFPLPILHASSNGGFLTNGEVPINGISERDSLGSDESLGGALLTPIPWLVNHNNVLHPGPSEPGPDGELYTDANDAVDGPHGPSGIDAVSASISNGPSASLPSSQPQSSPITSPTLSEQSDASTSSASSTEAQLREQGGVTQGELLRQEQEAGIVPVDSSGQPMTPRRQFVPSGALAVGREPGPSHTAGLAPSAGGTAGGNAVAVAASTEGPLAQDDEVPHARGPNVIGMEDMGPQQPTPAGRAAGTLDLEAAVGRGRSKSPQPPPAADATAGDNGEQKDGDEMEGVTVTNTAAAGADGSEARGKGPAEVQGVEKLGEEAGREKSEDARDADGDIVVGDADEKGVETS